MHKKELISRTTALLKENNVRKPTSLQRSVLHISDDQGNKSNFVIRKEGSKLLFTNDDVGAILDAFIAVITDALRHGEDVSLYGFGMLGLRKRKARETVDLNTNERIKIPERFVPKFFFGNNLRMVARDYEMSLKDDAIPDYVPEELADELEQEGDF